MTTEKMHRFQAIFLLFATALLWSFGGVLIKKISWNPMAIAGARSLIALPVILILLRRPHLNLSTAQLGGAVCYAGAVILFVVSTKLTTAANAILLQYTAPVYVAILSRLLLDEKITRFDIGTIGITILGISIFFLDKLSFASLWGNIFALMSGMFFGGFVLLMRKQKTSYPLGSIFLGNILTALVCLPFMVRSQPAPGSWTYLIIMGLFQLGLSHVLYSIAIRRTTAIDSIMIPIIEPVLNPFWVFLCVGETPGRWAILGGLIVVASVLSRALHLLFQKRYAVS